MQALAIDARGYLWIGTADGLNRSDGSRITRYRARGEAASIPADFITALAADGHRYLYVGTSAAYLTIIDVLEDTMANVPLPVPEYSRHGEQRVNDICIDREERIWVAHGARCMSRFDPATRAFRTWEVAPHVPTPPAREVVMHIDEATDGMLWLSLFRGIASFDPEKEVLRHIDLHAAPGSPGDGYAFQIRGLVDDDSSLVFGTWSEGIFRMRKRDGEVALLWPEPSHKPTFVDHMVQDMARMDDDKAMVATIDQGVLRLDLRTGSIVHFDRSLSEERCRTKADFFTGASCFFRKDGLLCIGSFTQGTALWSPAHEHIKSVQLPQHAAEEIIDEVLDIRRDPGGRILALSHRRGLFIYDSLWRLERRLTHDQEAHDRRYLDMEQLGTGKLLLSGMPNWAEVSTKDGTARTPAWSGRGSSFDRGIWWARGDGDHGLWCMTGANGLFHVDTMAGTCRPIAEVLPDVAALLGNWPWDVFVDAQHRTWFLSATTPPVVHYPDGHTERIQGPTALAPFEVSDMAQTPDGRIWFAVKHTGLAMIERGSSPNGPLVVQDRSATLPSRNITDIAAMIDNSLWMTLPNALQHWDPSSLAGQLFTVADGVPSGPLNLDNGHEPIVPPILVGTWEGFFQMDATAHGDPLLPHVQLPLVLAGDSLLVRNADLLGERSYELPYKRNRVTVHLRSTNLFDPERDEFAYRLIGYDTAWTITGTEGRLIFNSLHQGGYHLEVKARTNGGPWGEVAVFGFTVLPPFWATWWFRTLLFAGAALAVWSAFRVVLRNRLREQRVRLEREHALLEERMRIAHDLHDDLGSGLALIAMEGELARMGDGADPRDALRRVTDGAREVTDNMRRIVWALGSGQDTLGDLVAYIRSSAAELLDRAEIDLEIATSISTPEAVLSTDQRRHLLLITKELLLNVVKHAQASRVTLRMQQSEDRIVIAVADNGRGFDPVDRMGAGTGSMSMRERAKALHGTLSVQSVPGHGTTVELDVPLTPLMV